MLGTAPILPFIRLLHTNAKDMISTMKSLPEIERRLIEMFSKDSRQNIIAVLLFGSVASGRIHEESDIDVAVLFPHTLSDARRQNLIHEIYEDVAYYFIEPVDVISLNDANLILSREILSKGRLVICRDSALWKEFRDSRLIQYLDYKKALEKYYPRLAS